MAVASPAGVDQFLQPQSMITPGALGAIAMLGTNTIAVNFPTISFPIMAIILSFLFGLAALVKSASILEKILYYVLNSIIIFSVAAGSNKLGQQVEQHSSLSLLPSLAAYAAPNFNTNARAPSPEEVGFFKEWFPPTRSNTMTPPDPKTAPDSNSTSDPRTARNPGSAPNSGTAPDPRTARP